MKKTLILLGVFYFVFVSIVVADVTVKSKIHATGSMGMWSYDGTEVLYVKGKLIRSDTDLTVKGMAPGVDRRAISITDLTKRVFYQINPEESTYSEITFEDVEKISKSGMPELKVKKIDLKELEETRKLAGYECHGLKYHIVFEPMQEAPQMFALSEGEVTFWIAPRKKLEELAKAMDEALDVMQTTENLPLGDAMKSMWEEVDKRKAVVLGMEVVLKMEMDEEMSQGMKEAMKMMRERTGMSGGGEEAGIFMKISKEAISVDDSKLDADLFAIPKGFTKQAACPSMEKMKQP